MVTGCIVALWRANSKSNKRLFPGFSYLEDRALFSTILSLVLTLSMDVLRQPFKIDDPLRHAAEE